MAATLTVNQKISFDIKAVDRKGNDAPLEAGSVKITSSDESVFTVEMDADDETKGTIIAQGVGTAQLDFSADADLGGGVTTISDFAAVEVKAEQAVGFGITFGEPEDK